MASRLSPRAAAALLAALLAPCSGIVAPSTSLETVPVAYFGGNRDARPRANVEMLAKMRFVMIEKWEGPCWTACLQNATRRPPLPCAASCNAEADMLRTCQRVKALRPEVSCIFYLNMLMSFPFYALDGRYEQEAAWVQDANTGGPLRVVNDNGMPNIHVYDFGTEAGRRLLTDFVRGLVATGLVDGVFGDKWPDRATRNGTSDAWKICNIWCGGVTAAQAEAFNRGKAQVERELADILQTASPSSPGLLYGDGQDWRQPWDGNFVGPWGGQWQQQGPHEVIRMVRTMRYVKNYPFVFLGCADQDTERSPGRLASDCRPNALPKFLLAVEPGVFLGANGWDPAFDHALGQPLGPAENVTDEGSGEVIGLTRSFASGTSVFWDLRNDSGSIRWGPEAPPAAAAAAASEAFV